ncbi:hypothetical protein CHARACLAT_022171 [Characodon lateralis]|uniref:Uncharacterized protein n=1 Tax=Characodon lateralis TaxID=208331 RepID=A0ABU7DT79_9TELE|nr:hypothetical protein [Characodon lateralis]
MKQCNSSIHFTVLFSHGGSRGSWCISPAVYGQGTPWTGRQSITGQHRHKQDKQPCTQSTWREPTHARGEHANSIQKDPRPGIEPRTFKLQGNSATTMQPLFYSYVI